MTAVGVILGWTSGLQTLPSTLGDLSWNAADHMSGSHTFWTLGDHKKIVVPAGVSRLKFYWGGTLTTAINRTFTHFNLYNASAAVDVVRASISDTSYTGICRQSPIVDVSEGDEFTIACQLTSAGNFGSFPRNYFSCVTPDSVVGAVSSQLLADTTTGAYPGTTLAWTTPGIDTHGTFDGTTGFVVPSGVNYCIPSLSTVSSSFDTTSDMTTQVLADGVIIAEQSMGDASWWARGFSFGPRAVTPGQTITLKYFWASSSHLVKDNTWASIEWLG